MHRRRYLALCAGVTTATVAGCVGRAGDDEYDVGMTQNAFDPLEYETTVGSEVVWRNTSSRGHTVTAYENAIPEAADYFASGGYDSESDAREAWEDDAGGRIESGGEYSITVDVPGTYHYVCLPHEPNINMVGWLHVHEE